jgi:hypothetical protein
MNIDMFKKVREFNQIDLKYLLIRKDVRINHILTGIYM